MESEDSTTKIEQLNNLNCHHWKISVEHLHVVKDLPNFPYEDPLSVDTSTAAQIACGVRRIKRLNLSLALVFLTTYSKTSEMLLGTKTYGFLLKMFSKGIHYSITCVL